MPDNKYTTYADDAAAVDKYVTLPIGVEDEVDMPPEVIKAGGDLNPRQMKTAGILMNETASMTPTPGADAEFAEFLALLAAYIPISKEQLAKPVFPAKGKPGWNLDDARVSARWDLVMSAVRAAQTAAAADIRHFVFAVSEDGKVPKKELNPNLAGWVWQLIDSIFIVRGPFRNTKTGDVPTTDRLYGFFYNKK